VNEHLDTQGKLNPRRGLHYFLCLNKTQTPLLGVCDTLKIVQNILDMRSYGSQSRGGQKLKKQATKHYKVGSQTLKNIRCMLLCCY
jgi:hypothetical protein